MIEKLTEGRLLSGGVGADAPFCMINPGQTRADSVPSIQVEIVRALHAKGVDTVSGYLNDAAYSDYIVIV